MTRTAASRAQIRPLQAGDHEAVQALFARHGWPVRSRAGWDWALIDNPARRELGAAPGWVLEHDQAVVGFLGNLPLRYHFQGQPLWGATCTSYLVDEPHRAQSVQLMRAFAAQPGPAFLHSATANARSAPVYRAFRFDPAADPGARLRLRWVASDGALLEHALAVLGIRGWTRLARTASPLVRTLRQACGWACAPRARRHACVERLSAQDLGAEWDRWAAELSSQPGLWLDRSARSIAWRLSDPELAEDLALFAVHRPGGDLLGMCMARLLPRACAEPPKAELMDWALLPAATRQDAADLLQRVLQWARSWDVAVLDAKRHTGHAAAMLGALAPNTDPLPGDAVWIKSRCPQLAATVHAAGNWSMTGADSDDWFCMHRRDTQREVRQGSPPQVSSAADNCATRSESVVIAAGSKRSMSTAPPVAASTADTSSISDRLSSSSMSKTGV